MLQRFSKKSPAATTCAVTYNVVSRTIQQQPVQLRVALQPKYSRPPHQHNNNNNNNNVHRHFTVLPNHCPSLLCNAYRKEITPSHTPTATRRSLSSSSLSSQERSGLFSIPELQTPNDFAVLTQQAIQQCNTIRSSLAATVTTASNGVDVVSTTEEASHILCQLDDISKIVCNVIDAAELCRSAHASTTWRNMAHEAFVQLSDYLSILNADTTLYEASRLVSNTQPQQKSHTNNDTKDNIWNSLCEEERRFVQLLQAEFVRDGIHLSHDVRMQVREIQNQLVQVESRFLQNITHSRHLFAIRDSNVSAVTDVIPLHILTQHGGTVLPGRESRIASMDTTAPTTLSIQIGNTDTQIIQTLLRYSSDANLRQQIYCESVKSVSENVSVLQELIQLRHELATIQNFHSYVERNLLDKMIGTSTSDVLQFLNVAAQQNQRSFREDMTLLSKTKQQIEGNATLDPWDINYYSGMIKAHCHQDLNQNVSQYLSISNCINAMQLLVHELFGITMQESKLSLIEQWDVHDNTISSSTKIRKFQFTGPDDRPLGTMYLDLHPRDNKYNHAAHFTVRCGCAKSPHIHGRNSHATTDDEEQYQYPIIALVCNLSDSVTLSHGEVETLFHEFGHALHSLLSRTKFQHLSGTRTALDFVETPSHLFENFVWDTKFLQLLGRHHSTGEEMPMTMIQQIQQSRYQLASIERQNQILYSLFDQTIFGSPGTSNKSSTQLFGELHKQLNVPYAEGTHWYTRFGHLVSYGGGYYGYLYSQVFARDIWTQCFQQRSLDRKAGNQLWHKMLRYGGAKDPHMMLNDVLGRSPEINFSS